MPLAQCDRAVVRCMFYRRMPRRRTCGNAELEFAVLIGFDMEFESCPFFANRRRRRAELKFAAALDLVESEVAEHYPIAVDTRRQHLAAPLAANSAHLEHVGEINSVKKI